jgi:cell division protein FtsQ
MMSRSFRAGTQLFIGTAVVALVAGMVLHGRPWLEQMAIFHVTEVRVNGVALLPEANVQTLLALSPDHSLLAPFDELEARLLEEPLVASVTFRRRLPGTLEVRVQERVPVAFLPSPQLVAVDVEGVLLPRVDPRRDRLDLPLMAPEVLGRRGMPLTPLERRTLASEVVQLGVLEPRLAQAISEIALDINGDIHVTLVLPETRLLFRPPVTGVRLQEAVLVLADVLERRGGVPPAEVDLRFGDQVVIRDRPATIRAQPNPPPSGGTS